MTIQDKIDIACERLNRAIETYKPIAVFGLFSGGHDSLSATYVASKCGMAKAVHINTGIGVQRTRQFVYDTCREQGWELLELKAIDNHYMGGKPNPMIYRQMVMKYGFPGPGKHGVMYIKLKERALVRLAWMYGAHARGKNKRRIMHVTGVRTQESVRRMGHVDEVQVRGREVWVSPIHDWTKSDTSELIEYVGLKRSPVVDLIHKSGECLCGAFAKPGELEELSLWPETRQAYDEIIAMQAEASAAGVHCKWGTRPPKERKSKTKPGLLCQSCMKAA